MPGECADILFKGRTLICLAVTMEVLRLTATSGSCGLPLLCPFVTLSAWDVRALRAVTSDGALNEQKQQKRRSLSSKNSSLDGDAEAVIGIGV